jgi:4-hydroxybenzoate polyprenyltransferase
MTGSINRRDLASADDSNDAEQGFVVTSASETPPTRSVLGCELFLIRISRPFLWPILPMVYYLGMHAAGATLSAIAVVQMALLTLPVNLVGCGLNDLYDIESDRRNSRRRAVWSAVVVEVDHARIWRACVVMAPLVLVGSLLTRSWWNIAATCGMLIVAWAYSVPPVRLKERPPLDSLSNGLGYFLLPFVMGYSLGADPLAMPLKYWLLGLCVCGIHALATAADFDADAAAGHRTFAVAFGQRSAAAFAAATFLVALLVGNYRDVAVQFFLGMGAAAGVAAAAVPRDRVIAAACTTIFVGFLVAAICHVVGI